MDYIVAIWKLNPRVGIAGIQRDLRAEREKITVSCKINRV